MLTSYLAILGFIAGIVIAKHTKDEKRAGFVYFKALCGTILAAFAGISLIYLMDLITVYRVIYQTYLNKLINFQSHLIQDY